MCKEYIDKLIYNILFLQIGDAIKILAKHEIIKVRMDSKSALPLKVCE